MTKLILFYRMSLFIRLASILNEVTYKWLEIKKLKEEHNRSFLRLVEEKMV